MISNVINSSNLSNCAREKLTKKTITAVTFLLFATLIGFVTTLLSMAVKINKDAYEQSVFYAEKALLNRKEHLSRTLKDYAFWGEAYEHLHKRFSFDWAYTRRNLGPTLFENFKFDGIFVLAPNLQSLYSLIEGKPSKTTAEDWIAGDLVKLAHEARAQEKKEAGIVALYEVGGRPALIAAARITPGNDPSVETTDGLSSIIIFVDILTPQKLLMLGHEFGLNNLQASVSLEEPVTPQSFSLTTEAGTHYVLSWDALQPGKDLLLWMLPSFGLVSLLIAGLYGLAIRKILNTSRKLDHSYQAIFESEKIFRDIARTSSDWLWEINGDECFTYLSERFEQVTGHPREAWLNRPLNELLKFSGGTIKNWLANPEVQKNPRTPLSCSYQSASGKSCLCDLVICGEPDPTQKIRGVARDITSELESLERIQQLQQYDLLTGLPNRTHLLEHLTLRVEAVRNSPIAVLNVWLDGLSRASESHGRAVGDRVLVEASQRLEDFLRHDDLLAHNAPDEFIIVLDSGFALTKYIESLCEKLIHLLEKPFYTSCHPILLSARIGIATLPADASTAAELLRAAEIALHHARRKKKNKWCFVSGAILKAFSENKALENDLNYAIANNELTVFYQPRVNTQSLQVEGIEALVRWHHPQRGLLGPDTFIPIAEESGVICALGEWVLQQACAHTQTLADPLYVSINLSPKQFYSPDLVKIVQDALTHSGLPGHRMELEITESCMLDENGETLAILGHLKALGLRLAMDDFGTGYSSLSYLQKYPFDVLKIDRNFIADLHVSARKRAIVLAIIQLGHALNIKVTAEGVENQQHYELLKEFGCDELQGYFFGKPSPIEFLARLDAKKRER